MRGAAAALFMLLPQEVRLRKKHYRHARNRNEQEEALEKWLKRERPRLKLLAFLATSKSFMLLFESKCAH